MSNPHNSLKMNKLNITYKRVKQVAMPLPFECSGIDVIVNGEVRLCILKDDPGFVTYDMEGKFFCGGFDVLLRENKEVIERILSKEAAEAAEQEAADAMPSQIDDTRVAVELAHHDNRRGEFTEVNPSDLVYLIDQMRGDLLQQDHMTHLEECGAHKRLLIAVNRLRAANDELKAVQRILNKLGDDLVSPEEREGYLPGETYFGISV